MRFLLAFTALVAVAAAQEQCSCAPQPVVIQLSCGGKQQAPEPAPAPAPAPIEYEHTTYAPIWNEPPPYEYTTEWPGWNEPPAHEYPIWDDEWKIQYDPDRANCHWTNNGAGSFFLNGDITNSFYLSDFEGIHEHTQMFQPSVYDRIIWYREDAPKPSEHWDGSASTLNFPMPEKGSELYNLLMCWPLLGGPIPAEWNIKSDTDRTKCQWIYGNDMVATQYGQLEGGFPTDYRLHTMPSPDLTYVESPPDFPRPPSDWDGRESTLGFPMPAKGTPQYNMLLCWPFDVTLRAEMPDYGMAAGR